MGPTTEFPGRFGTFRSVDDACRKPLNCRVIAVVAKLRMGVHPRKAVRGAPQRTRWGRVRSGRGGEEINCDAVEFCRILARRGDGEGLLEHKLPL